jgi:hypothetical protein
MKKNDTALRSTIRVVLTVACMLLVPLVAMQFSDEVRWSPADFAVAFVLLAGTGLTYQWVARKAGSLAHRAAVGLALGAALLLVWVNLAVGIIGDEGNPANAMYIGVLVVGIAGSAAARLRPRGMARAMFATALAQALVAAVALALGLGAPATGPLQLVGANGMFVALFIASALLFRHVPHGPAHAGAGLPA